jgi:hypothetical protein
LTYELAKQLKDAGFPQGVEEGAYFIFNDGKRVEGQLRTERSAEISKIPTLSELIEACGDEFGILQQIAMKHPSMTDAYFEAVAAPHVEPKYDNLKYGAAGTLEEAIANLWLALHPKA